jgi:uncharacterized protein YqiB (DUF1249 family)
MFDDNCGLIIREHFFISGNVWDEFKVSMVHNRYRMQQQRYIDYINKQVSLGLKDTTPNHFLGGFLIRNMKHPQINKFNETWYSHILECGIQDQISLFFVKQLYPKFIKSFDAEPHH